MKIHKAEIDIKTAGLLLFIADNADCNGIVRMGIREIARRIGENPKWVSRHIKTLEDVKLIHNQVSQNGVTENICPIKAIKCSLITSYEKIDVSCMSQNSDTEKFQEIWKYYRRDGSKGNKTNAYKNYISLSQKDKVEMKNALPYFLAFTLPKYRPMLSKFIKDKYWKTPREFNGKVIPMDKYRIADIDAFKDWFNGMVKDTGIPMVTEVTPERHVNLNICYTLYPKLMSKAMKIVTTNGFYIKGAKDGWLTFDYIFNPVHLIEICEKGGCDEY